MPKTNPKRIPRTERDVRRAFEEGVNAGVFNASAIFLTVLLDKYGMKEQIQDVWDNICKLSEEIGEHRVSLADLKHVLRTEYNIAV